MCKKYLKQRKNRHIHLQTPKNANQIAINSSTQIKNKKTLRIRIPIATNQTHKKYYFSFVNM